MCIAAYLVEVYGQPGTKLSEDCCKYGVENPNDEVLAKAASMYGDARKHAEKEIEDLNKLFLSQVGKICMKYEV